MNRLTHLSAAAGLFCCLAASPALADLATPASGSAAATDASVSRAVTALQAATGLTGDLTQTVPDSSLLAAATKSTTPASGFFTNLGVDKALAVVATGAVNTGWGGSNFPDASQPAPGNLAALVAGAPGAPPAASPSGGVPVGSGVVVSSADSGLESLSSAPLSAPFQIVTDDVSTVPLPPALFLLGSGLFGLIPLRRSSRALA